MNYKIPINVTKYAKLPRTNILNIYLFNNKSI